MGLKPRLCRRDNPWHLGVERRLTSDAIEITFTDAEFAMP